MGKGHRPGASDLRQNESASPMLPQRTSAAGWQEAKVHVTSPELFIFFQLRTTWQQKCLKGSEDISF